LQLATQQLQLQNGVLYVNFFLQLATQRLLRCKLQEKLLRATWPLGGELSPQSMEKMKTLTVAFFPSIQM